MKRIACFAISLLLAVATMGAVQAKDALAHVPQKPVFAIQSFPPTADGYFLVELNPGESVSLAARVATVDSMPLTLRAFATNALSIINGGFGAGADTDVLTPPATWITFPSQRLTMQSSDHVDIPFSVSAPADALPGQYVSALVAQTDGPIAIEGTSALAQIIRSAIPVVVTIPGPVNASFTLGQPQFTVEKRIAIPVTNNGNILVRPEGEITLARPDGTPIAKVPVNMGSVFAGMSTIIQFLMPPGISAGNYVISGTLADRQTNATASIAAATISVP